VKAKQMIEKKVRYFKRSTVELTLTKQRDSPISQVVKNTSDSPKVKQARKVKKSKKEKKMQ